LFLIPKAFCTKKYRSGKTILYGLTNIFVLLCVAENMYTDIAAHVGRFFNAIRGCPFCAQSAQDEGTVPAIIYFLFLRTIKKRKNRL
jgi:hypothetical protein